MRSLKLMGFVALVAVIFGTLFAWFEIRRGFSARAEPSSVETFMATTARKLAVPSKYRQLHNTFPASPKNIQAGMEHFADHCATCHANDGSGETEIGQNLYPGVPDMRQ